MSDLFYLLNYKLNLLKNRIELLHKDFQSNALPIELFKLSQKGLEPLNFRT